LCDHASEELAAISNEGNEGKNLSRGGSLDENKFAVGVRCNCLPAGNFAFSPLFNGEKIVKLEKVSFHLNGGGYGLVHLSVKVSTLDEGTHLQLRKLLWRVMQLVKERKWHSRTKRERGYGLAARIALLLFLGIGYYLLLDVLGQQIISVKRRVKLRREGAMLSEQKQDPGEEERAYTSTSTPILKSTSWSCSSNSSVLSTNCKDGLHSVWWS